MSSAPAPERIGLYGGSFDPVHTGHLLVARDAMEQLGLARMIFIPAAISPHKLGRAGRGRRARNGWPCWRPPWRGKRGFPWTGVNSGAPGRRTPWTRSTSYARNCRRERSFFT